MAGVLWGSDAEAGVESTGVYKGILMRDMIDCVNEFHKPFIDVFIDSVFFKDTDYPLTYVPMFNMVLPLKKDQEVWVYFNQNNHRYPVLWKLVSDVDENYTGKLDLPSNGNLFSFPSAEDTKEVLKFSDNCWFIGTESYGVFRWGEQCILLNNDSIITNAKGNLNFKSDGVLTAEATNGIQVESSSGKVTLKAMSNIDLGTLLYDVFNALLTNSPQTNGTPSNQAFNPSIIKALGEAVTKLSNGFKE
jgi:hypothetical protein